MPQLWPVALRALFRRGEVGYTDFEAAMTWFAELGKVLSHVKSGRAPRSWLSRLCSVVTELDGKEKYSAVILIKYGWRRKRGLLGGSLRRGEHIEFLGFVTPVLCRLSAAA